MNVNDSFVTLVAWRVMDGQEVAQGDSICTIETTKAAVDIESPCGGYVFRLLEENAKAKVGETIGWILDESDLGKVEKLRADAQKKSQGGDGPTISHRAKAAMERHGLTELDFASYATVRESDVEAMAKNREYEKAGEDTRISSLDVPDNSLLIYGTGSQGVTVLDALHEGKCFSVIGFVDYAPQSKMLVGLPVFHAKNLPELARKGATRVHVCLPDYEQDTKVAAELKTLGFSLETVAHPSASIAPTARYGAGCFFGALTILGPEAKLGERVRVLNGASIAHHCTVGDGTRVADGARLAGNVIVGKDCLIGLNATVNLRITIGDRVTVVSGANVYEHIQSDQVVRRDGRAHAKV